MSGKVITEVSIAKVIRYVFNRFLLGSCSFATLRINPFLVLFLLVYILIHPSPVKATSVSNIRTVPEQPAYNQQFECIIATDTNDSFLACDLMPISAPDTDTPWDLCPKSNYGTTGFKYFANGERHYQCLTQAKKGVPGPGTYRIVAWLFSGDGYVGDVIYSRPITIVNYLPPTATPIPLPSETPLPPTAPILFPTNTPFFFPSPTGMYNIPTVPHIPTATRVPYSPLPTLEYKITPRVLGPSPTFPPYTTPPQYTESQIGIIPTAKPTPQSVFSFPKLTLPGSFSIPNISSGAAILVKTGITTARFSIQFVFDIFRRFLWEGGF
jgi:hypothetical protein